MTDSLFKELLTKEFDGLNTQEESRQLREYLQHDEQAKVLYNEFAALYGLLEKVEDVDSPSYMTTLVMSKIHALQSKQISTGLFKQICNIFTNSLSTTSTTFEVYMKQKLIIGGIVAVIVGIVYVSFISPWPLNPQAEGTIGAVKKYHSDQIGDKDVKIDGQNTDQLLANNSTTTEMVTALFKTIPLDKQVEWFRSLPIEKQAELYRSMPVAKMAEMFRSAPIDKQAEIFRSAPIDKQAEIFRSAPIDKQAEIFKTAPVEMQAAFLKGTRYERQQSLFAKAPVEKQAEIFRAAPLDKMAEIYRAAPLDKMAEIYRAAPLDKMAEIYRAAPLDKMAEIFRAAPLDKMAEIFRSAPLEKTAEIFRTASVEKQQELLKTAPLEMREQFQSRSK